MFKHWQDKRNRTDVLRVEDKFIWKNKLSFLGLVQTLYDCTIRSKKTIHPPVQPAKSSYTTQQGIQTDVIGKTPKTRPIHIGCFL